MKRYAFLAFPHGHEDPAVVKQQERAAELLTARLFSMGFRVYSTLPSASAANRIYRMPPYEWRLIHLPILEHAHAVFLVCTEGWETDTQLRDWTRIARAAKKPVFLLYPDTGEDYWEAVA